MFVLVNKEDIWLDLINVTRSDCLKVETHPTVASMKVSLLSQVSPTSSSSSTLASPFPSLLMVIPDRTVIVMVMVMIKILDLPHISDDGVERIENVMDIRNMSV